ncbi:proline-rich protein 30-like isoform X2 [Mus caroli]|uniref:Proline-rich protein 30-like isoform X2 n=1 Tax=Mus caroli TaxID=10089 RepID=A0A6P5QMD3_MUSCR|nr:proline-rich protein 30-like isoform X2 [Mus caroli]
MLPQNKNQVLLQNAVPPACFPHVFSQFVDSPPRNLASPSPHQTLPSSHFPLPATTQTHFPLPATTQTHFPLPATMQTHFPRPYFYSLDSNSDFVPLPSSSSLPRSSSCFRQNCTYFGEKLPSPHSTSPSNYQLYVSPPLTCSFLSQLQNSSSRSCQSPSRLQNFQSSKITSPGPSSPSGGIQSKKQAGQRPQSRSTRSSKRGRGCVPSKVNPAEFKDPGALTQVLVDHVGRSRIARDLQIQLLQRLWLGTPGPAPVVEYPICLVCLQLRTPSCPTSKYKTIPRLLAFPKLLPCAQCQEPGPLRIGIGFGLRLTRGQAKALNLLPPKNQRK